MIQYSTDKGLTSYLQLGSTSAVLFPGIIFYSVSEFAPWRTIPRTHRGKRDLDGHLGWLIGREHVHFSSLECPC